MGFKEHCNCWAQLTLYQKGLVFSGLFHAMVVLLLLLNLPSFQNKDISPRRVIPVRFKIENKAAAPPEVKKNTKKKKPKKEPSKAIEKKKVARQAPKKLSAPETLVPKKSAAQKAAPKPKKQIKEAALNKEVAPSIKKSKEKQAPNKEDPQNKKVPVKDLPSPEKPLTKRTDEEVDLSSVMKTLDAFEDEPSKPNNVENLFVSEKMDIRDKITVTELDALIAQIQGCWNIPSVIAKEENLKVVLHVIVGPDGNVKSSKPLDSGRISKDPIFRAAVESAQRALTHKNCSPLRLPRDKYVQWKEFHIIFNPKDIIVPWDRL